MILIEGHVPTSQLYIVPTSIFVIHTTKKLAFARPGMYSGFRNETNTYDIVLMLHIYTNIHAFKWATDAKKSPTDGVQTFSKLQTHIFLQGPCI